ncbi:unnamed protein product [Oikopleura dioica]|uniref:Uncharacterized protein n=1 Tax=Oikopleura dioica TaxID=34765 RepID=E4Y2T6_OIKDI|nr:unnamed protein product [Oikopleura dioica]
MVACNEDDKKLLLWNKLSPHASETLEMLEISEVDLAGISLDELFILTDDFFKSVAENQQSTMIANELNAKLDKEKSDLDFIHIDEISLNVPAEITDAATLLGANVSSYSNTQQDVVTKIEQMKTQVDCQTFTSESDSIIGELESIDGQFFARKEEQADQLENQLIILKKTLCVEKESLETYRKAGEDIYQTEFLMDKKFVAYSSFTKNMKDLIKNLH